LRDSQLDSLWKALEKNRTIGDTNLEIIRDIRISYLSEKPYIKEETLRIKVSETV